MSIRLEGGRKYTSRGSQLEGRTSHNLIMKMKIRDENKSKLSILKDVQGAFFNEKEKKPFKGEERGKRLRGE